MSSESPTVFVSYSHRDERQKERLATHLSVLRGRLAVWDDRQLQAGDDWYAGIEQAIATANVAVLLISADFLASDFIAKEEVPRLLKRRQQEGLTIVPVLLKGCAWAEISWLSAMQMRPTDARPLMALRGNAREEALAAIATEVLRLAEKKPRPVPGSKPPGASESTQLRATAQESGELHSPPSWASRSGKDSYGEWASFEVEGVEQRMQWIAPGSFTMGSPETEDGRFGDEGPVHEVSLTQGFWLANTPCTQALWEAVMGQNPSLFLSPQRPVDRVSWEDCQRFIKRLNQRIAGLDLRLPSEAEWEYSCRAGTTTATWQGDLEILGQNNAPRLHALAWYGGNSGLEYDLEFGLDSSNWPGKQHPHLEAGSREVAQKIANPWGLYDMLGNVDEWCRDGRRWYTEDPATDPEGSSERTWYAIRGGSWLSDADQVRAAYRYKYDASYRYIFLGFRLSQGPERGAM